MKVVPEGEQKKIWREELCDRNYVNASERN